MALILIAPPSVEPVTLSDVKLAGRIDTADLDAQIAMQISAYRQQAEHIQGRRLITQTVEMVLDAFPAGGDIDLRLPDVQEIVSVKYYDPSGSQQTLPVTAYSLDSSSVPCWLLPVDEWPETKIVANCVRIRYVVGYGSTTDSVPATTRLWIIAQVVCALENQAPPEWADGLLDAGRVYWHG